MNRIEALPAEYLKRMKELLGDEYEEFLHSYEEEPVKALRFNTRKVRPDTMEKLIAEWKLEPVSWCPEGFRYQGELRPGLSPYHDAGVYYIQEPSAMITAASADIRPDDIVLDLCAAPGGKSTQAAAKAKYLVSNEPIPNRARILSSNIERMGFTNVLVTSAYPDVLSGVFPEFFDKIIVDAPCSGEGMMRKDETAISEWSPANVAQCIARQEEILESAAQMLRAGGRLIYSTCTFEPGENEDQIQHFIDAHPEFDVVELHRIYPHKEAGEGHFCAVLEKDGEPSSRKKEPDLSLMERLLKKKKVHVLRCGLELGESQTDRKGKTFYTPSHAEALAKDYGTDPGTRLNLKTLELAETYLSGDVLNLSVLPEETYDLNGCDGWLTVYYDGYPLGNGKLVKGVVKNHYPKGLRRV